MEARSIVAKTAMPAVTAICGHTVRRTEPFIEHLRSSQAPAEVFA
jgi:hypothetical protein